ncbi:MAG: DUF2244 domain-containing protein [Candidatus Accumulibacter sp. UW25]|jgi:uncharacterized membrane protein
MVEVAAAVDNPTHLCVTARPNSVSGRSGLRVSMWVLIPACTIAGTAFLFLGAWPVSVFMGLHIALLAAAFRHVERHSGDFERLLLDGDRLIVDTHTLDQDEHMEFNSHWVQVALRSTAVGGGNTLALRSHGKEVIFGRLLSDAERMAVSRELGRRLARIRQ